MKLLLNKKTGLEASKMRQHFLFIFKKRSVKNLKQSIKNHLSLKHFLLVALLSLSLQAFAIPASDVACEKLFPDKQTDLFDVDFTTRKASQAKSKKLSQKEIRQLKKTQAEKDFLLAFERKDLRSMRQLVENHSSLKEMRLYNSDFLDKHIKWKHRSWCPEGWSFPQIASYMKDIELLDLLLDLDFNIRTKKKQGGLSVEHNPLHIAIKRDFTIGAQSILRYEGYRKLSKKGPRRLIDEKNQNKHTPWGLAVGRYMNTGTLKFIRIISIYRPSGYVQSWVNGRPLDGLEIALKTRNPAIINKAKEFLTAKHYDEYSNMKEEFGHEIKPPEKP